MSQESEEGGLNQLLSALNLERFATSMRADFRFAPLNAFLLVAIFVAGLVVHLSIFEFSVLAVAYSLGSALALAIALRFTQVWESVVILGTADCLFIYLDLRPNSEILIVSAVLALMVGPSIRLRTSGKRRCYSDSDGFEDFAIQGSF